MSGKKKILQNSVVPTVRIAGKDKPSLLIHVTESTDGSVESYKAMCDAPLPRDRVFELLELHESATAEIIREQEYVHAKDDIGSLLRMARQYSEHLQRIRRSIKHYEKYADNAGDLSRYFDSMRIAIELAGDLEFLTMKRYEKPIIRGGDDAYDGNSGISTETQREIVRFVRGMRLDNPEIGVNESVRQAMSKFNVKRSRVLRCLQKF